MTNKKIQKYMLGRVGQSKVWIGATDQKTEGKWEWSDNCSPWGFEAWIHPPTHQRKDNCAELYNRNENDQGWNDAECHKALNFVCARVVCPGESINKQLNSPCQGSTCEASCVSSCPSGWETSEDRCYLFGEEEKDWFDAENHCKKHHGY